MKFSNESGGERNAHGKCKYFSDGATNKRVLERNELS